MAVNGNNIIVYSNGAAIAGTRSNEIETQCETIEVTAESGQWRKYIAGRKEWRVSVGFLVSSQASVLSQLLNIGTAYTLKVFERGYESSRYVTGTAILRTCKITATRGNLCQGSFEFVGISALQ
jgi:predicted secreted protein